ncbi:hypothetical protein OHA72_15605 [Dactylosporangium sp. NBC_01737]|uniref:hypothetical protein n=1 Tax=Dactylosporangium sp. NBC_01737 TaxID=2975959 RepID=UPI002E0D56D0|nr:hypothetical protein OHA72_15605 [Dactylosporangium sp. NBC_01737]
MRVGKFDWERLMMVSPLPWPTRSILHVLAIYMDDDGGSARPGLPALVLLTRSRSVVIEHLQAAVDACYLAVIERGGYRRGTARATEYAATVPVDVYTRREEILAGPPWRRVDSPTSGQPNLGGDRNGDERPASRTLAEPSTSGQPDLGTSRRSGFGSRRSGFEPRTSGQPDPINHLSSTTQHQSAGARSRVESLISDAGARDDEIQRVIENIQTEHQPRSLGAYVAKLAESGDLADKVTAIRTPRHRTAGAALPVTDDRCPRHRGSPASNCGPCRSEQLGAA